MTDAEIDRSIKQFLMEKRRESRLKKLAPDMLAVLRFIEPALPAHDLLAHRERNDELQQAARMVREVVDKVNDQGV